MMNRYKRVFALAVICCMLMLIASGCRLALPDGGDECGSDELIGMVVTIEDTDDDSIVIPHDIIYAAAHTTTEHGITKDVYEFEDIDGVPFYLNIWIDENGGRYNSIVCDERVSDRCCAVNGDDVTLTGTIYVSTDRLSEDCIEVYCWLNPVYRRADGQVYMKPADTGLTLWTRDDMTPGSQTFSISEYMTGAGENKHSFKVEVTFETVEQPELITVTEMDENDCIVGSTDYLPSELPERIETAADWLLVTSNSGSGAQSREIYSRTDETMHILVPGSDLICTQHITEIVWK